MYTLLFMSAPLLSRYYTGELDNDGLLPFSFSPESNVHAFLVRRNRSIFAFPTHGHLQSVIVQPGDVCIVKPHGEIVPFVARAFRNRILHPQEGVLCHIDAHFDNSISHRRSSIVRPAPSTFYEASTIALLVDQYIRAHGEEEATHIFFALLDYVHGDIETFLAALGPFFEKFSACILRENHKRPFLVGPVEPREYIHEINFTFTRLLHHIRTPSLRAMLERHPVALYSIDADVVGTQRADHSVEDFRTKMAYIIDGLRGSLRHKNTHSLPLFTISIDPAWCAYPVEFLQAFFGNFYKDLIAE